MKVILISGKARSGKDQSAFFIKNYLENNKNKKVVIIKYGDFLKSFLEKSLGWDGKKDESGRTMLQQWGTNVIRKNYEYSFTDMMVALLKGIYDRFDCVIISDVRFPNEIEEIKKSFDCVSLRVMRDLKHCGLTNEQMKHPSETAMDNYDFDSYIYNKLDLDTLQKACEQFCDVYFTEV